VVRVLLIGHETLIKGQNTLLTGATTTTSKHVLHGLKQKRDRLVSRFLQKKAPDFISQHAMLLDNYFIERYEQSKVGPKIGIDKNPYAIVALGGYGRQEQCIHSDVDLIFLFNKAIPSEAEDLIHEVIYPLWDAGFDVGYATRSINECRRLARNDFEVLTSLLDARFICGVSFLYSDLLDQIQNRVVSRKSDEIVDWLVKTNTARHGHFGDSTYLLEPNLKKSQGGLRDYHTILWLARIKYNLKQVRDLEYDGLLSHEEFKALSESLSFIWDVRNRLHHLTGRNCDQLHFEYQVRLASDMKFTATDGQQPVELFLKKLHSQMEVIKQQHLSFLYELGYVEPKKRKRRSAKKTKTESLEIVRNMLGFTSPEEILRQPELLVKIFEESARCEIPLNAEAKRLVKEFVHFIDADFRSRASVIRSFERILLSRAEVFGVLDEMLNTGFLIHFIPGFKGIVNRVQFDEYHIYPVDKHTLRTVQTLNDFGTAEGATFCSDMYKTLSNQKLLLWAALLHDIGKGIPGKSHSQEGAYLAGELLAKLNKKNKEIETITFLIREHLLLIETATRRDINDEETAIFCARKIKDPERLKMLYLLTVADSLSTGPKAWNEWTSTLLRELFLKTLNIIEKGELASREAVEAIEKKEKTILESSDSTDEKRKMKTLMAFMSPRYLLYMPRFDIMEHIKLYNRLGNSDFVWKVTKTPGSDTRTVTVCARDRPGFISKIAGVFTLNSLNIIDVQVYTWRNNIALDIFEVTPPPDLIFENEKWERTKLHLQSALLDNLDLGEAVREKMAKYRSVKARISTRPHRIQVDNESSSFFTLIEVFTYDFPGLLFSITDALFRCRLDVWIAKIGTKADQVVDVFYVRDFDGQKIDSPDHIAEIKGAVEYVLTDIGDKTG